MRTLISLVTVMAFIVSATIAPNLSHAMPHATPKQETQASKAHDCHKEKLEKDSNESHKKCCDKGMCKCIGGTCFNGLSKIFNNNVTDFSALTKSDHRFRLADENRDSALSERLKRPPRA